MGKEKLTSKRRAMAGDDSMEARVSKKLGLIPLTSPNDYKTWTLVGASLQILAFSKLTELITVLKWQKLPQHELQKRTTTTTTTQKQSVA